MTSRRMFVRNLAVAAVGTVGAAPIGFAAADRSSQSEQRPTLLNHAAFAAQINTPFAVAGPSGSPVELILNNVRWAPSPASTPPRRRPLDAAYERFSLIFSGPSASPLAAAIHNFEHGALGRFEMYFGEIGLRNRDWIRYEAVFNQPAPLIHFA